MEPLFSLILGVCSKLFAMARTAPQAGGYSTMERAWLWLPAVCEIYNAAPAPSLGTVFLLSRSLAGGVVVAAAAVAVIRGK